MGIAIGLAGIILLNSGGNLSGNPGALMILIGSLLGIRFRLWLPH
jgi:hypothetical protein